MTLTITLLGTGSPMPSPDRAGPATLISAGDEHYLVDAGRGVLMRLAAIGLGAPNLTAVLLTHLHSDHITDLNDVITTRWVMTFGPTPLTIIGPIGTQHVVDHIVASLEPDIGYRIGHHEDLAYGFTEINVIEVEDGPIDLSGQVAISCAPTDHKPVHPTVGFRFDHTDAGGTASAVTAGDTVPCEGLDRLCAGAHALVHTVIRKDIIATVPIQRMLDTVDYHSSPQEAAQTAERAGIDTLVLTHYVPAISTDDDRADWRALAAQHFSGAIEIGDDLHQIVIAPT